MTGQPPSGGSAGFGWGAPDADDEPRRPSPSGGARDTASASRRESERTAADRPRPRDAARTSSADLQASTRRRARELDPAERRRRGQRRRFYVVAAVTAAVLAVGAGALGVLLNPFAPEPEPIPPATPTAGPAAPGFVAGGQLTAGQCFASFSSAWQHEFELAPCTEPHAAELFAIVTAAEFAADAEYPGEAALRAEAMRACQAPSSLNHAAASDIEDLRIDAAYPMTQGEWDAGVRSYWCFASRESGEALTTPLSLT